MIHRFDSVRIPLLELGDVVEDLREVFGKTGGFFVCQFDTCQFGNVGDIYEGFVHRRYQAWFRRLSSQQRDAMMEATRRRRRSVFSLSSRRVLYT